jgi:peptidoglycan hydrolase-like protein with peptidoglycan-binding domain
MATSPAPINRPEQMATSPAPINRPEQMATSPAPINFSDRKLISRAQIQLKTLGFDPGTVDGELGQQTEAALQVYQHAHRLPETGRLDEVTLRSLLPQMREGALR